MPRVDRPKPIEKGAGLSAERFARLGLTVFLVLLLGTGGAMALEGLLDLGDGSNSDQEQPWWRALAGPLGQDGPADVLAVWTSGGLPQGFAGRVDSLEQVAATSVVAGDLVDMTRSWDADGKLVDRPAEGMAYPLDALAIDADRHDAVFGEAWEGAGADLESGEALLSESSAEFRGLGPGAVIELATGDTVSVAGVVDDVLVGSAELVVPAADGPKLGVTTDRSLLVRYTGERGSLEQAVRVAAGDEPVDIAGPQEGEAFRHAATVLPQVALKKKFGEFAYRPGEGRGIVQDEAWVDANIVTVEVPILGRVECHRKFVPSLRGALADVEQSQLRHTIDLAGYAGCYQPRLIKEDSGLSRHAWGIAVDINANQNPYGTPPRQDPRLVKTFERWGFTWGGRWLVPDGMHFEYVAPPESS